jgi:hypothetical protein
MCVEFDCGQRRSRLRPGLINWQESTVYTTQEHAQHLENIKNGLATKVRILIAYDACPVCKHFEGAYTFDEVPELPLEGCSRVGGCNAFYAPVLDRFGP